MEHLQLYLCLLIGPVCCARPPQDAHVYDNLHLFAQFLFWRAWWPRDGRHDVCVACPINIASRHGQGRAIRTECAGGQLGH